MARTDRMFAGRRGAIRAAFAVGCVVAAAFAARGADPDVEPENPAVPHVVMFRGVVGSASRRVLRVGDNTVLLATHPTALPLADGTLAGRLARIYPDDPWSALGRYERARVGDTVIVRGSLREDGAVLAFAVWPRDWPVFEDGDPDPAAVISGVCEDAGDGWVVVGGRRVAVGEFTAFDDEDRTYGVTYADMLRIGDAAFLKLDADAEGGLSANYAKVHQTGGGTILDGTIRGWDDSQVLLDVDGVQAQIDDYTTVVAPDGSVADMQYFEGDDVVGRRARIAGYLRDGRIYADRCVVTGEPDAGAATKRAVVRRARPGRLRMRGVVTATTAGGVAVNGLAAELRAAAARRVAARWKVGGRIRVDARLVDGRIVARVVARR